MTDSSGIARPVTLSVVLALHGLALVVLMTAAAVASPIRAEIGIGHDEWSVATGLAFWTALTLITSGVIVWLPGGGSVSVALAPQLAATALGGPLAGGLVELIGTFEMRELCGRVPLHGIAANHVVMTVPAITAGFAMDALGVVSADPLESALIYSVGAAIMIVGNDLETALFVRLSRGRNVLPDCIPTWPARLGLGSLAWLMAEIVVHVAWWGVLMFALPLLAIRDAYRTTQLTHINMELATTARTDPLTSLGNRLRLQEDLVDLSAHLNRHGGSAAMLLLDLDRFKRLNDLAGHQAGDEALRRVAAALRGATRSNDSLYRYGGEEFLLVTDGGDTSHLAEIADRIVAAVAAASIPHPDNAPWGVVTVSAGIAVVSSGDPGEIDRALRASDDALYRAKEMGRNRAQADTVA